MRRTVLIRIERMVIFVCKFSVESSTKRFSKGEEGEEGESRSYSKDRLKKEYRS